MVACIAVLVSCFFCTPPSEHITMHWSSENEWEGKTFYLSRSDGWVCYISWHVIEKVFKYSGLLSVVNGSMHVSYVQGVM